MFVFLLSQAQAMPVTTLPGGIEAYAVTFGGALATHALASSIAESAGDTLIGFSVCEEGPDSHAVNGCLVLLTEDSAGGVNYRRVSDDTCGGLTAAPCYGGHVPQFQADIVLATGGAVHLAAGDLRAYTPLGSGRVGSYLVTTDTRSGRVQLEIQDIHGGPAYASAPPPGGIECAGALTEQLCDDVRVDFMDAMNVLGGYVFAWASTTPAGSLPSSSPVVTWDPAPHAAALRDLLRVVAILESDELHAECLSDPLLLDARCAGDTSEGGDPEQPGDGGGNTTEQCDDVGAVCFESSPPHIEERTDKDGNPIRECVQSYCIGEIDANCNCSNDECSTITVPDSACD